MSFVGFVYLMRMPAVSRGLGSCESWIVAVLGVDRHGAEVRVPDLVAGWAHWQRVARGIRGPEACDCPGRCTVARRSQEVAVHRAVRTLEGKGLVAARFDAYQRKVIRLADGPVTWRPGQGTDDAEAEPVMCGVCGVRAAGQAFGSRRRRAA